jgi:hypothetical protein
MAAAIQQALIAHDRVRRTTDIPLFYGRKGKDTIEPQQYIERLERAVTVAQWPDDQMRCDEFVLSLWDNALSWYSMLDNIIGFDKNVWNELKKKFLEAYAPKYSAKALCICFQDLRQKNDETSTTGCPPPSRTPTRVSLLTPPLMWARCTQASHRPRQTRLWGKE